MPISISLLCGCTSDGFRLFHTFPARDFMYHTTTVGLNDDKLSLNLTLIGIKRPSQ